MSSPPTIIFITAPPLGKIIFIQLNLQVDGSDIDEPTKVPEAFANNFPSFCNNICLQTSVLTVIRRFSFASSSVARITNSDVQQDGARGGAVG